MGWRCSAWVPCSKSYFSTFWATIQPSHHGCECRAESYASSTTQVARGMTLEAHVLGLDVRPTGPPPGQATHTLLEGMFRVCWAGTTARLSLGKCLAISCTPVGAKLSRGTMSREQAMSLHGPTNYPGRGGGTQQGGKACFGSAGPVLRLE